MLQNQRFPIRNYIQNHWHLYFMEKIHFLCYQRGQKGSGRRTQWAQQSISCRERECIGKMAVNPSAGVRDICARGMAWGSKGIKHNALQKIKKTGQFPFKQ